MLDRIEYFAYGFSALVILAVGFLYLFFGVPTTTSPSFVQPVKALEISSGTATRNDPTMSENLKNEILKIQKEDDRPIIDKLKKQGVKVTGGRIKKTLNQIPASTFEIIRHEPNVMKQLHMVGGEPIPGADGKTRFRIVKMAEEALLGKLGFESGDVIELIDGEIVEFNEMSKAEYFAKYRSALEKVSQGGSVSVTITRNRQPVHLVFSL